MHFHASAMRALSALALTACFAAESAAQHIGDINLTVEEGAIHTGATTSKGPEASPASPRIQGSRLRQAHSPPARASASRRARASSASRVRLSSPWRTSASR